jgi:hypothetical protein
MSSCIFAVMDKINNNNNNNNNNNSVITGNTVIWTQQKYCNCLTNVMKNKTMKQNNNQTSPY